MNGYHVDSVSPADHQRLLEVWEASVRATHDFVPEEKIVHLKNLIIEKQYFYQSDMFCVRDDSGEVGGFAGTSDESLDMLFLHPSMIGTGAGKTLMQHAITQKGATRVDVNEQNVHAREFYEHFGFEVIGRSETDDNGEPFPLLHMKRSKHFHIRRVTISDLKQLLEISYTTYHETFFESFNDATAFDIYTRELFDRERIVAELADNDIAFYFAMDGELPIGYTKLNFGDKQTILKGTDAAEIERIYVLKTHQGQKTGKALLEHSIATARNKGLKMLWLGVWENNQRAIKFYERHGFQKFNTHQYLVGDDPQTDELMKINL